MRAAQQHGHGLDTQTESEAHALQPSGRARRQLAEQAGEAGLGLPAFEQANRQRIEPGDAEKSLEGAGGVDETRRGRRGEENRAALGQRRRKRWLRQKGGQIAGRGSRRVEIHELQRLLRFPPLPHPEPA